MRVRLSLAVLKWVHSPVAQVAFHLGDQAPLLFHSLLRRSHNPNTNKYIMFKCQPIDDHTCVRWCLSNKEERRQRTNGHACVLWLLGEPTMCECWAWLLCGTYLQVAE